MHVMFRVMLAATVFAFAAPAAAEQTAEVGVEACDEFIGKRRACYAELGGEDAQNLKRGLESEIQQYRTVGPAIAKTLCEAQRDDYRERKLLGCEW
jgi:hypothetical protein